MRIWNWMLFGSRCNRLQQQIQSVLRLHTTEVRAMWPQLPEQRLVIGSYALANDGNTEPGRWWNVRGNHRMKTVGVVRRSLSKAVQLMSGPKVGRKLLHELGRGIHPIETFQPGRKLDLSECLKPRRRLFRRQ